MLSPKIAIQAPEALKNHQEGLLWEYARRIGIVEARTRDLLLADNEVSEYLGEDEGMYQLQVLHDAQERRGQIDTAHAILQYEGYLIHGFQPQ